MKLIEVVIFISAIFTLYILLVIMPVHLITNTLCLKHGYRESRVDIFFNVYCEKRINQTDVIVPIEELE